MEEDLYDDCSRAYKDCNCSDFWEIINDERCTPMQFTWLLDKNWKEIYEGDLLDFTFFYYWESEVELQKKWEVRFGQGAFYFSEWENVFPFIDLNFDTEDIEVIWNIYENPDLLSK